MPPVMRLLSFLRGAVPGRLPGITWLKSRPDAAAYTSFAFSRSTCRLSSSFSE